MTRRTNKMMSIMLIAALLMFAAHPADAADERTFGKVGGIAGGAMATTGTAAAVGTAAAPAVITIGGAIIIGFGIGWAAGKTVNAVCRWWNSR